MLRSEHACITSPNKGNVCALKFIEMLVVSRYNNDKCRDSLTFHSIDERGYIHGEDSGAEIVVEAFAVIQRAIDDEKVYRLA